MNADHLISKQTILSLMSNPQEEGKSPNELSNRITQISSILHENPELNKDVDIFQKILVFTDNKMDVCARKFRREQSVKFAFNLEKNQITRVQDKGLIPPEELSSMMRSLPKTGTFNEKTKTLTILDALLSNFGKDDFWNYIKDNKIRYLRIETSEGVIMYDQTLLVKFIEKGVPISALANVCKLIFDNGEKLCEPEATLHLCGKWFTTLYNGSWTTKKNIDLRDVPLPIFTEILNVVKTGIPNPVFDYNQEIVKGYLDFSLERQIPENVYGKDRWLSVWGDVGAVPPPPNEFFDALQEYCPFENKNKDPYGPKKIDTHEIFYMPAFVNEKPFTVNLLEILAKDPKFGFSMCFETITDRIRSAIGEISSQEGYWFIVPKKFLEETRGKDFLQQFEFLTKNFPGYDFPFVLEGLVYTILPYCSGLQEGFILGREPVWTLTGCKEVVNNWHVAVGGMAKTGAIFNRYFNGHANICLLPVQRFLRK